MAITLLTDVEYKNINDNIAKLKEYANDKDASPRAASHFRAVVKAHADFIAVEDGKRALDKAKKEQRATQEQERIQRQQARLQKLQEKMKAQPSKNAPASNAGKSEKSA
jgi:ABC-type thiamine transport system substrate-binding protein